MDLLSFSILVFGTASYVAGLYQIKQGKYKPSVFSRVIWLFLAINTFVGVYSSKSTPASILLAGIFLAGNAAICLASLYTGDKKFGKLEYICSALLLLSILLWFLLDAPLANLGIGLLAHFVGALPTYKKVLVNPTGESTAFWSLFFIASSLSIVASWGQPLSKVIFPLYYTFFDGSLFLLSLRKPKVRR